jgi:hypothetical protein
MKDITISTVLGTLLDEGYNNQIEIVDTSEKATLWNANTVVLFNKDRESNSSESMNSLTSIVVCSP